VIVGDALAVLILVVILAAAGISTARAAVHAHAALKRAGRSDLVAELSAIAVGVVVFAGGWLIMDAWWLLRACRSSVRRLAR
jgi:hypothetical protein